MEVLWADVRYGLRSLAKNRGFALVAVMTLALGIGANTAVFSLTDQVLLRLLPVQKPEELVVLRAPGPKPGHLWADVDGGAQSFSYPAFKELRERNEVFSGLLGRFVIPLSVSGQGQTERGTGELVSGNYFQVLGVRPAAGRVFTPEDETAPGANPVAVLSYGFWLRRYGAKSEIMNQTLTINGHPLTVVGVAQAGFQGVEVGNVPDVFIPITMKAQMTPNWDGLARRSDYWLQMIGRRKPGLSLARAEAGLQTLYTYTLEQDLASIKGWSGEDRQKFLSKKLLLMPGGQGRLVLQSGTREPLLVLSALVGLVLLIACANVANLLIARSVARQREIAVRLALGARRVHLLRQLLIEGLLLAVAGGLVGLVIAAWAMDGLLAMIPADQGTSGLSSQLDLRLLAFNFGAAMLTGVLFAVIPAWRATSPDLVTALKEQGAGGSQSRSHVRLRKSLVAAQIAFTAVILIGAGLFARSLTELKRVHLGIRVENVLTFSVAPELNGYEPAKVASLFEALRADIAAIPGVTSASGAALGVLTDSSSGTDVTVEGYQAKENEEEDVEVAYNWVGPDFFKALRVPLARGREFTSADAASSAKVAVINDTMAKKYFEGRNPIGMHLAFGAGSKRPDIEIVGVVPDSKHATVREKQAVFVYFPFVQNPRAGQITYYVFSPRNPASLAKDVRKVVERYDSHLPIFGVKTLERQLDESLLTDRLLTLMSLCFAGLAALLAAVGLYGLMAYTVARRTREIGIRIALGASQRNVSTLVVREAMTLALIGLLLGLPAAVAAGKLAESIVYGVKASDPLLLFAASALLAGVMLMAAYIPARRAARVDPMVALRYE